MFDLNEVPELARANPPAAGETCFHDAVVSSNVSVCSAEAQVKLSYSDDGNCAVPLQRHENSSSLPAAVRRVEEANAADASLSESCISVNGTEATDVPMKRSSPTIDLLPSKRLQMQENAGSITASALLPSPESKKAGCTSGHKDFLSVSFHCEEAGVAIERSLPSPTPQTEEEQALFATDLMLSPSIERVVAVSAANLLQLSWGKDAPASSSLDRNENETGLLTGKVAKEQLSVVEEVYETRDMSMAFTSSSRTHLFMEVAEGSTTTSLVLGRNASYKSADKSDGLALFSKSFELASPSSKVAHIGSPSWQGKLRTDSAFPIPIVAYGIGDIGKSESMLKQLPGTLRLAKFIKLEEFQKILQQGVADLVTRFSPSLDASFEEVELFNSLVDMLSGRSGPKQTPYMLDLGLGQQALLSKATSLPLAALMSWDDETGDRFGTKLHIVSSSSLRFLEGSCADALCGLISSEELDQKFLFGVFSTSTTGTTLDLFKVDKLEEEMPYPQGAKNSSPPTIKDYLKTDVVVSNLNAVEGRRSLNDEQRHASCMRKDETDAGENCTTGTLTKDLGIYNHNQLDCSKEDFAMGIGHLKHDIEGCKMAEVGKGEQRWDLDVERQMIKETFVLTFRSEKMTNSNKSDHMEIHSKKRELKDTEECIAAYKRPRESKQAASHKFDQDGGGEKIDLHFGLLHDSVDDRASEKIMEQWGAKREERLGVCCLDQGTSKVPVDFDGARVMMSSEVDHFSEMEATYIPLTVGSDRLLEDLVPLNWDDILPNSPQANAQSKEISCEFQLAGLDKETQTWLCSKQSALYLQEEFGVNAMVKPEVLAVPDSSTKMDMQTGSLHIRISMVVSDACDPSEAKWFVDQAAYVIRATASRGVFIKCLWYEGPVQLQPGYGPLSVAAVVKKIKGDDGKNLERMQNVTGVMIGVVLRKGVVEPKPQARYIGLRLKSIRRKGLLEASRQAEALLACVGDYFAKEFAASMHNSEPGLQNFDLVSHQNLPLTHAIIPKLDPPLALSVKAEMGDAPHSSPNSLKYIEKLQRGSMKESDLVVPTKTNGKEDLPEYEVHLDSKKGATRPLYVSNLPDHITPTKIGNIVESALRDKLGLPNGLESGPDLVVDVRYVPDKFCAFVEVASEDLLTTCLKLYKEDKSTFQGMTIELGLSPLRTERQSSFSRLGARNGHTDLPRTKGSKGEDYGRRHHEGIGHESDSGFEQDPLYCENDGFRADRGVDKPPRPLFLTELMRNASAQSIKELFEEIITTYIGAALVSSSGRQLVLDVRYVPSRGCAFVDLATPELVEFMLDLHSRRPEVFMNMKMELGRRPVPYSVELEKRSSMNSRNVSISRSSSQKHGYGHPSSDSRRKGDKPCGSHGALDYMDDSDKGQGPRSKKLRSDPEKTVYADRLPEGASEGVIRRIFERVLVHHMTRDMLDDGDAMITEVRHIPTKYCAFVVFASEELTRLALQVYNEDEEVFEKMRLKPHFHSRLEDLYKDIDVQEQESAFRSPPFMDKDSDPESNDGGRHRQSDVYDARSRLAAHRAVTATAFIEVDRQRSVYVDKIPEGLSEFAMREMFEKVFQHKRASTSYMVTQVAYFRDKFDASKLCAFVELKSEGATQDLVDCYHANQDAFQGMRIRPGLKFNN